MKRFVKLSLLPSALTVAFNLALGFGLAELWRAVGVRRSALTTELELRAVNPELLDRFSDRIDAVIYPLIAAIVVIATLAAFSWFLSCWRMPLAIPGQASKRRLIWLAVFASFLLMGVAGMTAWVMTNTGLTSLLNTRALLLRGAIGAGLFMFIYFLSTWLFSEKSYRAGVPLGGLRSW